MFAALDSDASVSEHSEVDEKPKKTKQAAVLPAAVGKLKEPKKDDDLRNWRQKVGTKQDELGEKDKFRKFKVDLAADRRAADAANGIDMAFKQISAKQAAKKQQKKAKKKKADMSEEQEEEEAEEVKSELEQSAEGTETQGNLEEGEELMLARDAQQVSVVELRGTTSVDASDAYQPVRTFSALSLVLGAQDLPRACLATVPSYNPELGSDGGVVPSAVQMEVWGAALAPGLRDVIAISYTGSGKTLAFLVPILNIIAKKEKIPEGLAYPRGLVIAPTRELVMQITEVADIVAGHLKTGIVVMGVVGGVGFEHQRSAVLATLPRLLVATPGRLLGLCGAVSTSARQTDEDQAPAVINLTKVQVLVLDEADRLLDLGFEKDIKEIAALVAGPGANYLDGEVHPQTLLTSATWTDAMTRLAEALVTPGCYKIVVGAKDLAAARSVTQRVEVLDHKKGAYRERRLNEVLCQFFGRKICQRGEEGEEEEAVVIHQETENKASKPRVVVFVLFKKEADQVAALLKMKGFQAQALHGNMSQAQRSQVVGEFRQGSLEVLVATDVAARGLDIPEITHVVNYSVGISVDHYIHRIGRCGRAGRKGLAYTFVLDFDRKFAPQLIKVLEQGRNLVPQELRDMASEVDRKLKGREATRGEAAWSKGESKGETKVMTEEEEYELECRRENREKQMLKKHANQKAAPKHGKGRGGKDK